MGLGSLVCFSYLLLLQSIYSLSFLIFSGWGGGGSVCEGLILCFLKALKFEWV